MRKLILAFSLILSVTMVIHLLGTEKRKSAQLLKPDITYTINNTPTILKTERIGINLGQTTSYGTSQFLNNLLLNPGLEGQIDRILVIVSQANQDSFSDEAGWGYPNGEWNEAEFQIRTGQSAGKRGRIKRSVNSGDNGFPQYFSYSPLPYIEPNDLIVLTRVKRPDPLDLWETHFSKTAEIDPAISRPQSAGSQSLKLVPTSTLRAEITYVADAIAERAGKGLQIEGKWRFRVWAKGEKPNGELTVVFTRQNSASPFFKSTLELTTEWQEYVIDFTGHDSGPPKPLTLTLTAYQPFNTVWLDDLYLGKLDQEDVPFRKEIVNAINELSPSFIREFPSLGDSWENRVASPQKRKTWLKRLAGGRNEAIYSYSLPELIFLCKEVKANPWIIVPPTLSNYECQQMGYFLQEYASDFSEVILEFGHENWNWLFRPTAIPYYREHGILANHLFGLISKAAGKKVNLIKLVNGQYSVPGESIQFLNMAQTADGLAVTPSLLPSLDRAIPDKQALQLLYRQNFSQLHEIAREVYAVDKELALYEANFNTVLGDARGYERNRLISGAAAGSALGKHLIHFLFTGARPIMVYNLAQYDTTTWEVEDFVYLWGIVRDFGPPIRFRPTGLAVKLLNQVIQGSMYRLEPVENHSNFSQGITIAAFRGSNSWSLAAVSESDQPRTIKVDFPQDGKTIPTITNSLQFQSPFDNNEKSEAVTIETLDAIIKGQSVIFTLPAYGMVVIGSNNAL